MFPNIRKKQLKLAPTKKYASPTFCFCFEIAAKRLVLNTNISHLFGFDRLLGIFEYFVGDRLRLEGDEAEVFPHVLYPVHGKFNFHDLSNTRRELSIKKYEYNTQKNNF